MKELLSNTEAKSRQGENLRMSFHSYLSNLIGREEERNKEGRYLSEAGRLR